MYKEKQEQEGVNKKKSKNKHDGDQRDDRRRSDNHRGGDRRDDRRRSDNHRGGDRRDDRRRSDNHRGGDRRDDRRRSDNYRGGDRRDDRRRSDNYRGGDRRDDRRRSSDNYRGGDRRDDRRRSDNYRGGDRRDDRRRSDNYRGGDRRDDRRRSDNYRGGDRRDDRRRSDNYRGGDRRDDRGKNERYEKNDNFIFGIHSVLEAVISNKNIEKVFIQNHTNSEQMDNLVSELTKKNVPIVNVPIEKINRITRKNHQGVVCYLSPITYSSLETTIDYCFTTGKEPFIVVLDKITDVRNFGAICRTMECAGVDAIVVPDKGNALISGDTVKASSGALNHIAICRTSNLEKSVQFLAESGLNIVACSEKADQSLYDIKLTGPVVLVLGSEEVGITKTMLDRANEVAKIPVYGKISSLNVSVAAGIAAYEVLRQRTLKLNV